MSRHIHRALRAALGAAVVAGLGLTWSAGPASAHDGLAPRSVVAGSTTNVTLDVENESTQPTVGVEVRLPPGFTLVAPEQAPGWTSSITRRADGAPLTVRWTGGSFAAGSSSQFVLRGKVPGSSGTMVWVVAQLHGGGTWEPAPISEAPVMTIKPAALGAAQPSASGAPAVPTAAPAAATVAAPIDEVARSRAALAIVLGGLALLGVLVLGVALLGSPGLRRRVLPGLQARDREPIQAADPPGVTPVGPKAPVPAARPTGAQGGKSGSRPRRQVSQTRRP